jgi:hypothetical protein
MYVCFQSTITTTSLGLNVYTLPATGGNFYKSRLGAVLDPSVNIVADRPYIAYYDFSGNTYPAPTKFLHTPLHMTLALPPTGTNVGVFYNETMYYMSVVSATNWGANQDSFIVSETGFIMEDGITQPFRQPYLFQSASIQPLYPFSLQQILLTVSLALTPTNIGYTFILTSVVSAGVGITITGLTSTATRNGVYAFYNQHSSAIVITYPKLPSGTSTYSLPSSQAITFAWDGTALLLQ